MASPSLNVFAGFEQKVVVGVGDLAVSNNPALVIATCSLGSCLGVTIYDPVARVGGLLHFMLPASSLNTAKAAQQPAMFADTGLPALFRAAYQMKADKYRVVICVAGGAQMMDQEGVFNIGKRNYDVVARLLNQHGLKIQATEVGGLVSRTMTLNVRTGEVRMKISGTTGDLVLSMNRKVPALISNDLRTLRFKVPMHARSGRRLSMNLRVGGRLACRRERASRRPDWASSFSERQVFSRVLIRSCALSAGRDATALRFRSSTRELIRGNLTRQNPSIPAGIFLPTRWAEVGSVGRKLSFHQ